MNLRFTLRHEKQLAPGIGGGGIPAHPAWQVRRPAPPFSEQSRQPYLFAVVCLAVLLTWAACTQGPAVVLRTGTGATVRVRVEVVSTPEARAQGLMYRRELATDAGMLFVFPQERPQRFWMKNTLIPLDMLFIDSNLRVVGIVPSARPMSTQPVGVDQPARYVLEVNGGFATHHGVTTGTSVEFVNVPPNAS